METTDSSDTTFDDAVQSTTNAIIATTIVGIVVYIIGAVALVALVIAIIRCLQKQAKKGTIQRFLSGFVTTAPPTYNRIAFTDEQIGTGTIDRFINDMVRERPVRFSPNQLASVTNNYAVKLGSGGFGVVYKGEIPNGVPVAVKVLNKSGDKRAEEQFMAEVGTIGRTYHIYLVRLYGFCCDAKTKALVYEYMENGSLDNFLFSKDKKLEFEKLYEIAVGTAKGIAYLHEECQQRIIHYDIKPGNVLLDANFNPKVADFGLAKLCNRENTHVTLTGGRGTPGYAAPELWMPFPVTHRCDVYSFGMLLFEIVGGRKNLDINMTESQEWLPKCIWEKYEKGELGQMIVNCGINDENREKAERMAMVALWCVQYFAEARPPMSSVVKMLEGGTEIITPPNPFQHLVSSAAGSVVWSESSTYSTAKVSKISDLMSEGTAESFGQETTPIMKKYDIEVATAS